MPLSEDLAATVLSAHVMLTDDDSPRSATPGELDLDTGDCSCGLKARQFIDHSRHQAQELSRYLLLLLPTSTDHVQVLDLFSAHRSSGPNQDYVEVCSCGAQIGDYSDPRDLLALHRIAVLATKES